MDEKLKCWCGNSDLHPFSKAYLRCPQCETLVALQSRAPTPPRVQNDEEDFYGQKYWFSHQKEDLALSDITVRARTDLSERCPYWLRTLLKYKVPPGKLLELGSAHGGFVAMLRGVGFEAMGLELSPWVVSYACRIFEVPMLLGPLESQKIENNSLDGIFLMDVIEHLPTPVATMNVCLNTLKPDGFLMIQTPRFPEGKSFETMNAEGDPFLRVLQPSEHLYIFSESSIRKFFNSMGAEYLSFEHPIFDQYDMFFFVSRTSLKTNSESEIEKALTASPSGRLIQALLDLNQRYYQLLENLQECEKDRAARLELIHELSRRLQEPLSSSVWQKIRFWGEKKSSPK